MSNKCLDSNLQNNSGTSQAQRALEALSVGYAKVDERSSADLLLFGKKYGAYLNYYDANNSYGGDWSALMSKDISVIIAALEDWQAKDYISYINNLYDNIKFASTPADVQKNFKYIFDFVFSLSKNLNDTLGLLPADSDYSNYLNVAIASKLALPVKQINDYYALFLQPANALNPIVSPAPSSVDSLAPFDNVIFVPLNAANFLSMFSFINDALWKLPATVIPPPASMLAGDSISEIITNNFFTGAVTSFLNGIISIVNQTGNFLDKTLSNYPTHEPHYALYLTFLRLFKFAQDHLNNYTERHLKFYYKKVLQLKNNLGLPDTTHLVFTLQKSINQHLIGKGTQFKAGKNANNNDLYYSLTDDIVVNQASIQALKSLYLIKNYSNVNIPQQLFASPKADSADGQGAKVTSADKSWYPFGDLSNDDFKANSIAGIGFAIASNVLFLNEGTRTIKITFSCDPSGNSIFAGLGDLSSDNIFSAKFTGNKKWFDASGYSNVVGNNVIVNTIVASNTFSITITLNGNAPPIIPYSQKIHGGNFTQALPMVQVMIVDHGFYHLIKLLKITSITLNAGVDAVKNISLQNDSGKIDTSKPFKLFGEFPDFNSSLIIGSKEAFQKPIKTLKVSIDDLSFPNSSSSTQTIKVKGEILSEKNWSELDFFDAGNSVVSSMTISTSNSSANIKIQDQPLIPEPDFTADGQYTIASVYGFIKLVVSQSDFNLPHYIASVQAATAKNSVTISGGPPPTTYQLNAPSTPQPVQPSPTAGSLNISYDAETLFLDSIKNTEQDFEVRQHFFYHLEPFGFREMHPFLFTVPAATDPSLADNMMHILPVFNMENNLKDGSDTGQPSGHNNEGELWIGLSSTKPGETQSILFQVSEGSSNPLKDVTKVKWFYMSSNNWIAFDDIAVNDQTNNLSQSGLVIFNLQGYETINNTRADNNLLWIKAVVVNDTDAICKVIAIQANAAKAAFVTDISGNIYFTSNITANTISKPAIADAALKQTSQPYPSFGGVPKESDLQFDQRVSERLRHKHRGVTAWDYERLVLQNFPQVHKVKCLNHTSFKSATQDYSEMKPGDVMIITIPDLSLVTGANPLLPFTNVGLLDTIKKFIKPLCSPFVHVHVCNPQFEAVQFSFDVSFINNNSNSNYYKTVLDTDIQKFLMPWAFGSTSADIEFGGKIEKSVVLNFVQSRPYVDFVTCFTMTQYLYKEDGTFKFMNTNLEEAVASTARSILVPYKDPKSLPDILSNTIFSPANCNCNA